MQKWTMHFKVIIHLNEKLCILDIISNMKCCCYTIILLTGCRENLEIDKIKSAFSNNLEIVSVF